MEQEKLPNGVASILLSILGILCCCILGSGILAAGIGFYLANKSEKLYQSNPEGYSNYGQIKTAKIIAIVAIVLNILMIIRFVYVLSTVGWDEMMEQSREIQRQWGLPTE